MTATETQPKPERPRPFTRNTAETPEDLLAWTDHTAMPVTPKMLRTIGELIFPPPEPLPEKFFGRFAASVAADPERWGRVFLHALKVATKGARNAR